MKRAHKYLPIFPVLFAYGALLGYGLFFPGKWQLVSQLAFYCTLGQAFNLFMGMTGYVDFGYGLHGRRNLRHGHLHLSP